MTSTLSNTIERSVAARSLLQHPFYQAWSNGELTQEDLAGYAKEYYWLAKNVPCVMDAIMERMPADVSEDMRAMIAHNAQEEQEHVELWERFALSLGITKEELDAYEPTKTVVDAVQSLIALAQKSFEEGVAAMYAFECELPEISRTKKEGLLAFYGMESDDAHAYFDEHLLEEKHLQAWRGLLESFDPATHEAAKVAAEGAVTAQNKVLDGVVQRYLPTMECGCCEKK